MGKKDTRHTKDEANNGKNFPLEPKEELSEEDLWSKQLDDEYEITKGKAEEDIDIGDDCQGITFIESGSYEEATLYIASKTFKEKYEKHQTWLKSEGKEGERIMLRNANLQKVDLAGLSLEKACLREVNLQGANLDGANLKEADLYKANLESDLGGGGPFTSLKKVDLQQANLQGSNLNGVNLTNANIKRVNLQGASLIDATLKWADLEQANLTNANLETADLFGANLKGVDFQGANLDGANLGKADLQGAKNLNEDQIKETQRNPKTVLPDHFQGI